MNVQYRILYCTKCRKEFTNVLTLYGDYCPYCDTKLLLGYHFHNKEDKVTGVKELKKIEYDVRNKNKEIS